MTKDDEKRILLLKDGGISVKQNMRVMELEKNVRNGHLSFTSKDIHNFFSKIRIEQAKNDVLDFFEYCKIAKEENQNFQYSVTLDDERKVEHIFWSPAHCFTLYQSFGDVVIFDTTYKINAYEMSLGMFVGIDNHGRTILFGCALLRNETKNTFSWLMRTFVSLMNKPPKSILTDQDPWMTQAIAEVDLAIEDIGQNQLQARMLEKYRGASLLTLSPLEEQAQKVLTPLSFKKFQEQFERATHYTVHTNVGGFVVQHYAQDVFTIPSLYFPLRWHSKIIYDQERVVDVVSETQGESNIFEDANLAGPVYCPPKSKTKGRPKSKRSKRGKEVNMKQVKLCRFCKKQGHNYTTCPDKEKEEENHMHLKRPQKQ
ncbi:uncharacterized protein LOC141706310 [Apium graveolens]|uniref:uncharacterized protein LOC141706310 n=1 Tax=Apium graveolens TaxID=4045 RepID=UPI003D78F3ED